jgi:L-Ala-D/L-Glu epimerase
MTPATIRPSNMIAEVEQWPLATPFRISGYTFQVIDVLVVTLEQDGRVGRGEAAGVYYKEDRPSSMRDSIESVRSAVMQGINREMLLTLLPSGGARNALDCALWDLEAKLSGCPAWHLADLSRPTPVLTTFTCGADAPDRMAMAARAYTGARAIKLKLLGDAVDADRVRAVREALPDVWLGVDANQGFSRSSLEGLMPTLVDTRVALLEQPFPVGQEALLDDLRSAIPLAADESAQTVEDIENLVGRFDVVNIKLDKCGGLTAGLAMARAARRAGMRTMVGNMMGTSLAMAPAFLIGQSCDVVDLDGPVFLTLDRSIKVEYVNGTITCPEQLWGSA